MVQKERVYQTTVDGMGTTVLAPGWINTERNIHPPITQRSNGYVIIVVQKVMGWEITVDGMEKTVRRNRNYYQGIYRPSNPKKYEGDHRNVVFRSMWERQVFFWCDKNPDVVKWSSEEVVIPYICKTDGKPHRYFVDLKIVFKNGHTVLVEIKPESQMAPPQKRKRKTKKYIKEALTYAKNVSKWEAAEQYARKRGWTFERWGESALNSIGLTFL